MSREIKRGFPYPRPSGRELPLPSDMNNGTRDVVDKLLDLWRNIYKKGIFRDQEKTASMINDFYEKLDDKACQWLEGEDLQYWKPRGVLIKERAIQLAQIDNTPLSKRQHRGKKPKLR